MSEFSERWLQRLVGVISGLNWLFLAIGTVAVLLTQGGSTTPVSSMVSSTLYVTLVQLTPRRMFRLRYAREAIVLVGTIATSYAMVVTGGTDSPWLLLAVTPVVLASLVGGYRLGLATAGLAVGIVAGGEMLGDRFDITQFASLAGFDFLAAITFGYARRLILEAVDRADTLALMSVETGARLERLENTNRLLQRLSSMADTAELNPAEVGDATLSTVAAIVPYEAADVTIHTDEGPLTVASRGEPGPGASLEPLQVKGRRVGQIRIQTAQPLSGRQRDLLHDVIEPASVAFSNFLMLQTIARDAIKDERARLARELHDEIGPGLASLGLALDVAAMESQDGPLDHQQLPALRRRVTHLLDEVRAAVADLRAPEEVGLSATIARLRSHLPLDAASIEVQVVERRPVRPRIAADLYAIAGEAIRNAVRHSGSSTIVVHGVIDFDTGKLEIVDQGSGFDPSEVGEGHFGLIGMRERAEKIGVDLKITTRTGDGTSVVLEWEPTP